MIDLSKQRILVTGGHGFLGGHLIHQLQAKNPIKLTWPSINECNLLNPAACQKAVANHDIIIHAAAKVGGINANKNEPGGFFYENALMGIQLLEAARQANVKKFVQIGTVCEYPEKYPGTPYQEEHLWTGYPEETNGPYGLAKKALLTMGQAYRQQYGFNSIHLLLVNMYGPNDHFTNDDSHVLAALVHRFYQAKLNNDPEVVCWGTGAPTREFLYVEEAARGIILATEHYEDKDPINLGSGNDISIKDLADTIANTIGYAGNITWDTTKPDGQPKRLFDVSRAKKEFDFKANVSFEEGLTNTITWYTEHVGAPHQQVA